MGNAMKPNYQVRHLTTDDLEQYNQLLRYAFQVTEQELAETGWRDDEIKQSKFPVLERADVLGCFDGSNLISQIAVYPLEMNIYGQTYSIGFVTSVCTYPEYTGHGIMKRLMRLSLEDMRMKGQSFAMLLPYSIRCTGGLAMRSSPTKFPTPSRIGRFPPGPWLPAMCAGSAGRVRT